MGCEISTVGGGVRIAVEAKDAADGDLNIDNEGNDTKLNEKIDKFNNVLKNFQSRQKLRNFIVNSWIPVQGKDSNDLFKSEASAVAINFFDFWLDTNDYAELPKSAFQSYRACFLYEKYLMHGASRNVPITTNVTDECSQTLFGGNVIHQEIDNTLYEAAMIEAFDFLNAEVFPSYEDYLEQSPVSVIDSGRQAVTAVLNNVTRRRASMFNSPDRQALIRIMEKIMSDKTYFNTFKEYLKTDGSVHLLMAYQDLIEMEEKVSSMPEIIEAEMKMCRILHYLNSYHDRYLALSTSEYLPISPATRGDCLRKLAIVTGVDIFRPLKDNVFEILVRNHLDAFLASPSYRSLVRSGRTSVANIANTLQSPAAPKSLQEDLTVSARERDDSRRAPHPTGSESCSPNPAATIKELKHFISSEHSQIFGAYLQKYNDLTLMYFCQSSLRFKEANFPSDIDRVNGVSLIFQRYLSRNAEDQIQIPEDIRKSIMQYLFTAPQSIFIEATEFVLGHMFRKYWVPFRDGILNSDESTPLPSQTRRKMSIVENKSVAKSLISDVPANSGMKKNNFFVDFETKDGGQLNDDSESSEDENEQEAPIVANSLKIDTADPELDVNQEVTERIKEMYDLQSDGAVADSSPNNFMSSVEKSSPHRSSFVMSILRPSRRGGIFGARQRSSPQLTRENSMRSTFGSATADPSLSRDTAMFTLTDTFKSFKERGRRKTRIDSVTLKDLMSHPQCCSLFKAFLEDEGTSQTLLFLLEVEEFRRIPSIRYQHTFAQKIFYKFIHTCAVMPLPLTQIIRDDIAASLHTADPGLFQDAVTEVMQYIECYQFPRFSGSSMMNKVIALLALEAQQPKANKRRASIIIQAPTVGTSGMKTLKQVLSYQFSIRYFKDFCTRTYCHESILFWLDAENYQNLPGSNYMKRIANKVYKKYIADFAMLQINISGKTRLEISKNLEFPTRTIFKKAQTEIVRLMETDALPKFLLSKEYEIMSLCLNANDKLKLGEKT